jgi:hypothetical protein
MARRLTTNQEIAGSTPASVNFFGLLNFFFPSLGPVNHGLVVFVSLSFAKTYFHSRLLFLYVF